MQISAKYRESYMKNLKATVLGVVISVLILGVASPSHAQDNEALLQAAGTGNADLVRLLIGTGQSPNAVDSVGNSVLMFAAGNGQTEIAAYLIEQGADVNAANAENWTPLMMAALGGHVGAAQLLIDSGATLDTQADIGMTALIMAAASGQAEMVNLLLASGADAEVETPDGRTALMAAAEGGHGECVKALLEHGVDPNVESPGGFTALIAAQSNGHTEVVWSLVDAGAVFTTNPGAVPELLSNPDLEAPDSLSADEVQGSFVIQFVVGVDGKVEPESVKIIESPHEGLNEAVTNMFLGAAYKPAEFEGKPVAMRIRQSMSFGG
jgi:ankyrin repeat protein